MQQAPAEFEDVAARVEPLGVGTGQGHLKPPAGDHADARHLEIMIVCLVDAALEAGQLVAFELGQGRGGLGFRVGFGGATAPCPARRTGERDLEPAAGDDVHA